jgi:hypothetical protein
MNGTKQAFRLIVLRWANPQPGLFEADHYCYHAVATNREEAPSADQPAAAAMCRAESKLTDQSCA